MIYPHFYPHAPENGLFWARKREGVYPSLMLWSRWSGLNRRPAVYEIAPPFFRHLFGTLDADRLAHSGAEKLRAVVSSIKRQLTNVYPHFYPHTEVLHA